MLKLINLLLIILSLAACKTSSKKNEAGTPAGADYSQPPQEVIVDCNDASPKCEDTDTTTKMLCTADLYDGKNLLKNYVLQGFGVGTCAAREALRKATCAAGKKYELVGSINCVKDPSDGECPVADVACMALMQPVMCAAKTYDGRPLSDDQGLRAWGSNACVAQQNLKMLACKSGLRPSLLGAEPQCWDDQSEGECPVKTESCESDYAAHVCKATIYNGQTLTKPLAAFGTSECEAKAELQQQACNQGYRPSKLSDVVCQFDQDSSL